MPKILSLDIGDVRIGIACADMGSDLVFPVKTFVRTKSIKADVRSLLDLFEELSAVKIVIGKPENQDPLQFQRNSEIADRLIRRNTEIEFEYWNEAFTSMDAESELIDLDVSRKRRQDVIDQLAAVLILESYIAARRR